MEGAKQNEYYRRLLRLWRVSQWSWNKIQINIFWEAEGGRGEFYQVWSSSITPLWNNKINTYSESTLDCLY